MLLSTSARERRLWIWTAIVVATIFASLGLARSLAGALRDRELIDALFITGLFMIGVAVVAVGLRLRPRGLEIGVALGVAAVYLIVFARMTIPEERSHLIEYGVVALLVHEALVERRANGGGVARPALAAFAVTVVIGVVDECVQLLLPRRVFDRSTCCSTRSRPRSRSVRSSRCGGRVAASPGREAVSGGSVGQNHRRGRFSLRG